MKPVYQEGFFTTKETKILISGGKAMKQKNYNGAATSEQDREEFLIVKVSMEGCLEKCDSAASSQ